MVYFATSVDVAERCSERGYALRLDDNPSAIATVLNRATNRILQKLLPIYSQAALLADAQSGGVAGTGGMTRDLCTDLAVCELARRRGNAVAQTFKDVCKEANDLLVALHDNTDQLPNVATAAPQYPAWSNVRVIQGYTYKQVRVETQISDLAPPPNSYPQAIDWSGLYFLEY